MKTLINFLIISLFLSSCTKDYSYNDNLTLEEKYYGYTSFNSINLLDINNDGQINNNVLLELTNYTNHPVNLQVSIKRDYTIFRIYMPDQEIIFGSNTIQYVDFLRKEYDVRLDNDTDYIENYIFDADNKIISFRKISETKYKLIFQKKYYDFNTSLDVNGEFTIIYELND